MKYIFPFLIVVFVTVMPLSILAAEPNTPNKEQLSNTNLTVVVPSSLEKPVPTPIPTPKPVVPMLYPVNVFETQSGDTKQITKVYELGEGENPDNIPREGFDSNSWHYELYDIIKTEKGTADAREHTKTVTMDTETNDIETIINLLAPTIEYTSDDGYVGILPIDINSIKVETAGTKKKTFTITATREYPHLDSNDPSLVPKTINDNGKTLTLSNVDWITSSSSTVDYEQVPNSYTAIATYTTTASKDVITGYMVTANYTGTITKLLTEKTVYEAIFNGVEINPLQATGSKAMLMPTANEEIPTELAPLLATMEGGELEMQDEKNATSGEKDGVHVDILAIVVTAAVVTVGFFFLLKIRKLLKIRRRNKRKTRKMKEDAERERYFEFEKEKERQRSISERMLNYEGEMSL